MNYNRFEEFDEALVRAITKHMDMYEETNPNVWYLGKINLRYAIEREMYFNFIFKIEHFYALFIDNTYDSNIKKFKSDISKLMVGQEIIQLLILQKEETFLDKKIAKYVKKPNQILFSIISMKFLKYAEPIIEELKGEIHLLCFEKSLEIIEYMEIRGYSYTIFEAYYNDTMFPEHLKGLNTSMMLQSLINVVHNIQPETIVNFEGCHVSDQILCELGALIGVKTICIQHGYAPFYPTTFRNLNYTKLLTWGDYFSEGFAPFNQRTNIISVGNHIIDNTENKNQKVKSICFFVQVVKYYIDLETFAGFIKLIQDIAYTNQEIEIIVREHPSNPMPLEYVDQLKKISNIVFMNKQTHSVGEVLNLCDLAISISSASLVEALDAGVIPIYVNIPKLKMYSRLHKKNPHIPMLESFEESNQVIQQIITDQELFMAMKNKIFKNKQYLFKARGKEAIKNIIGEIE